MYKLFIILLTLLWLRNVYCITLNNINPNYVTSDFASKIETHKLIANVTFDKNESESVMMYIGDIDLNYDRELPIENDIYCINQENKLVTDLSRQENYIYSCCLFKKRDKFGNSLFECPIPPPEIDPDPFRTFFKHKNPILIKTLEHNSSWVVTDKKLEYRDDFSLGGILKKFLTFIVVLTIVISVSLGAISTINLFSNIYPKLFIFLHITSLAILFIVEYFLFQYVFDKKLDRRHFTNLENGLIYSMITTIYSLFIIYIPTTYNISEKKLVDQRIRIHKYQNKILYKIVSILKHKYSKDIFTFLFIILTLFQYNSIYSLIHSVRTYFDSEWQVLLSITISYSILSLLFIISFLTGIYEVKVPIRFNRKTGQMTQIIPISQQNRNKVFQQSSKRVSTKQIINNNYITGLCSNSELSKLEMCKLNEGDVYAIDNDIINTSNPYQYLFWKIGKIKDGVIEYDPELNYIIEKKNLNNCYSNRKIINLDFRDKNDKIQIYEVIYMESSQQISFVNIGYISKGKIHENHRYILKLIAWVFKIIPDYSEEYEYNVVENMRCEWHRITNNCGKYYGYIYQALFTIVTLGLLLFQFMVRFNIIEVLLAITMTIYTVSVNTRKVVAPKLRRRPNYKNLLNNLNKTKRDGENMSEYQIDLDWIRSNPSKSAKFSNTNYIFDLNWISVNEEINNNSYLEIIFERECPLIGLGIGNNHSKDIYDIMNPAIWYSDEKGIGIRTKDKVTWHNVLNKKNNNLTLGLGFINSKIYLTYFGETKYLVDFKQGGIICCLPPHVNYKINKFTLPNNFNDNLVYLPVMNVNYQYQLEMNVNLGESNNVEKISNYDPFESEIGYVDDCHYKFYTTLSEHVNNFQKIEGKIPKYKGLSICLNNLEVCSSSKPFKLKIEVTFNNIKNIPKFIAFGLVEKVSTSFKGFMDIVPGWKSSDSIAFHSDDGSILVGNKNDSKQFNTERLEWFNGQFVQTIESCIGYDGMSFYVESNNKRACLSRKNLPKSWLSDSEYIPVIYFNDSIQSSLHIKIQNTL